MAITYSLKVTQMDVAQGGDGQPNVVSRIHWAYNGTDGVNTRGFGDKTEIAYTPGGDFTPYDQLTEQQVAAWVEASLTPQQISHMQSLIEGQLAELSPPLPWTPPVEESPAPPPPPEKEMPPIDDLVEEWQVERAKQS